MPKNLPGDSIMMRDPQPQENLIKAESSPWTEPFQRLEDNAAQPAAETESPRSSAQPEDQNPTQDALSAIFNRH